MTQAQTALTPQWQEMAEMDAPTLRRTIEDGMRTDPSRTADQILIARRWVAQGSEAESLMAPGDEQTSTACAKTMALFDNLAVFNRPGALELAAAVKTEMNPDHPLYSGLLTFMTAQIGIDNRDYYYYRNIANSAAHLPEPARMDFVTRLEALSATHGYGVQMVLDSLLNEAGVGGAPSLDKAFALSRQLAQKPPVTVITAEEPEPPAPTTPRPPHEREGNVYYLQPRSGQPS